MKLNPISTDCSIQLFCSYDNFVQTPEFTQGFNRYSYCLNNPLKYTDPSGEMYVLDDYGLFKNGRIELLEKTKDNFDRLIVMDDAGNRTNTQMKLHKGNALATTLLATLAATGKASDYGTSFAVGDENSQSAMLKTFKFAADNSNVEWRVDRYNDNSYSIGTIHSNRHAITPEQMGRLSTDVVAFIHSHMGVSTDRYSELYSMGWLDKSRQIDPYHNSDARLKSTNSIYQDLYYYTYFPNSGNVWEIRNRQIPAFIRNVDSYQRFFWGTLNLY